MPSSISGRALFFLRNKVFRAVSFCRNKWNRRFLKCLEGLLSAVVGITEESVRFRGASVLGEERGTSILLSL